MSDFVTLELARNFNYELLTAKGELVLSGNGFNTKTVSLEGFAKGVHFFTLKSPLENTTVRTIKTSGHKS